MGLCLFTSRIFPSECPSPPAPASLSPASVRACACVSQWRHSPCQLQGGSPVLPGGAHALQPHQPAAAHHALPTGTAGRTTRREQALRVQSYRQRLPQARSKKWKWGGGKGKEGRRAKGERQGRAKGEEWNPWHCQKHFQGRWQGRQLQLPCTFQEVVTLDDCCLHETSMTGGSYY
jgi:hypothetical protein